MPKLDPNKVGVYVFCKRCRQQKCPRGRSAPMTATWFCMSYFPGIEDGCPGYREEPLVGDLWPGESEEDFGYACSDHGTTVAKDV
jgi:hypothetical protein